MAGGRRRSGGGAAADPFAALEREALGGGVRRKAKKKGAPAKNAKNAKKPRKKEEAPLKKRVAKKGAPPEARKSVSKPLPPAAGQFKTYVPPPPQDQARAQPRHQPGRKPQEQPQQSRTAVRPPPPTTARPAPAEEEDDDGYDDDDFEDYDDDFEDVDDISDDSDDAVAKPSPPAAGMFQTRVAPPTAPVRSPASAPLPAPAPLRTPAPAPAPLRTPAPASAVKYTIVAAPQQPRAEPMAAAERRERAERLRRIRAEVRLETEEFEILSLPAVSRTDAHQLRLGRGQVCNAGSQFNDDLVHGESQTDAPEAADACTQAPEDLAAAGIASAPAQRGPASAAERAESAAGLERFLLSFAPVVETLLEEAGSAASAASLAAGRLPPAWHGLVAGPASPAQAAGLATDSVRLAPPGALAGRPVRDVAASSGVPARVAVAFGPRAEGYTGDDPNPRRGVVCVWDASAPAEPEHVLLCSGDPACCAFGPGRGAVVLAGLAEGSVALWDLREPDSLHRRDEGLGRVLRGATFATDALPGETHGAPVASVFPLAAEAFEHPRGGGFPACGGKDTDSAPAEERGEGGADRGGSAFDVLGRKDGGALGGEAAADGRAAFQFASCAADGEVAVWTVQELERGEKAGSATDLGLNIGGRVKLLRAGTVRAPAARPGDGVEGACCRADDPGELFLASSAGRVLAARRFAEAGGARGGPRPNEYAPPGAAGAADACTSVASSAAEPWRLLAGYASGTVREFDLRGGEPGRVWYGACGAGSPPVAALAWSRHVRNAFFVAGADGSLAAWNLEADDAAPALLAPGGGGTKSGARLALSAAGEGGAAPALLAMARPGGGDAHLHALAPDWRRR